MAASPSARARLLWSVPPRLAGPKKAVTRLTAVPTPIDRTEVQRLVAAGAQLVDVLPRADYEREHLAGAVNIPLKELNREPAEQLDRDRPVVVYCNDDQ